MWTGKLPSLTVPDLPRLAQRKFFLRKLDVRNE